jgi:hypothetical protein
MTKLMDKIKRKKTLGSFVSNTFKKCSTLGKRFRSRSPEKGNPKEEAPLQ